MILTALELTYNQKVGILYAIPIALIIIAIIVYIVKGCKGLKKTPIHCKTGLNPTILP